MKRESVPTEEIEITEAMIEAGEDVLKGELGGIEVIWNPRDLAASVFLAMERIRLSSPIPD